MNVVGYISDRDMHTVNGIFKLYDTCGLPLSILFDELKVKSIMPCWMSFYSEAIQAGWKVKTIRSRLNEAIFDTYGKEFRDEVIRRLFDES